MSHHIYTTRGFIINSLPHGEAGKFFRIFTHDLGMIGATAQGVRLTNSKLRYHMQDYSYGLFSFVRGKEVWRITGAIGISGIIKNKIDDNKSQTIFIKILSLIKRLLNGEEKNEKLFEVVDIFYNHLCNNKIKENEIELIEYITVLRILYHLGYISNHKSFNTLLLRSDISREICNEVKILQSQIIMNINEALKESQL